MKTSLFRKTSTPFPCLSPKRKRNKGQEIIKEKGNANISYRYKIGDSFFQLPLSDAQSMLSTSTEQIDTDVSKLEDQLGELREELQSLKVALYARFGRSINLET